MNFPSVAIVIPTRNRTEFLKRCLSKLVPYVSTHPECSITVTDDGDASVTREALAAEMGLVQVVQGPRRGIPANRNCGAAHSTGDLLIFLDDDCIPGPNLIATYQEAALKNPEVGVFEGRISQAGKVSGFADSIPENETGGYLWSCNFAVRRSIFEKINGFDERLRFAAEDGDFYLRVKKHTLVPFLPEARVWHEPERRVGWKNLQHLTLSTLLFLHIHGLKATNRSARYFVHMAARTLIVKGWRHIRTGATRDPMHLICQCVVQLQIALILFAWRFHPALARLFYPACCPNCEAIHADLAAHARPSNPLEDGPAPADSGGRHAG